MEKGEKAEAQKIFDSIDLTKVEDPAPFINLAITKINDQKSDEAIALLEKLIARFPKESNLFYYRGRAYLAAKKLPEAKADLEKFVAAALPDARELPDAQEDPRADERHQVRQPLPALLLAATMACGGEGGSSPPAHPDSPRQFIPESLSGPKSSRMFPHAHQDSSLRTAPACLRRRRRLSTAAPAGGFSTTCGSTARQKHAWRRIVALGRSHR